MRHQDALSATAVKEALRYAHLKSYLPLVCQGITLR